MNIFIVDKYLWDTDPKYYSEKNQYAFSCANQLNASIEVRDELTSKLITTVRPNILRTRNDETSLPLKQLEEYLDSRCGGNSSIYDFDLRFKEVMMMNFTSLRRDVETLVNRVNGQEQIICNLISELKTLRQQYISHQSDHG